MFTNRFPAGVYQILCPTDLSEKSQKALKYAVQIAEATRSSLTAFHSLGDPWLRRSAQEVNEVERVLEDEILVALDPETEAVNYSIIVGRSPDPASEIVRLALSLDADLIVMKTRPGALSALHFGSLVERMVSRAPCPVMLLPSRFLAERDPASDRLRFDRILFDYDFSQATDELFHLANALTRNYDSDLHLLSVLEPPQADLALLTLNRSRSLLENAIHSRMTSAISREGRKAADIQMTIEWGPHSDRVLSYARKHRIDLICTALPAPSYLFEKIYRTYLGRLLAAAECPVLVKQCV